MLQWSHWPFANSSCSINMFFGGHLVLQVCRPEICDAFLKFQLQCASRCAIFVAVRRRRLNTKVHVCKHHIWFTGKFLAYKGVKNKTELNTVPSIYFQNCCNFAIDFQSYNSAMVRYKPRGEGVAAIQRDMRNKKAQQVVDWVMPLLDLDLVESSGELWPRGSLKKKKIQQIMYPWIKKTSGRWFTMTTAKLVCRKLWDALPMVPNRDPNLKFSAYIKVQAIRLMSLASAAKKHLRNMSHRDPANMDTLLDVDAHFSAT